MIKCGPRIFFYGAANGSVTQPTILQAEASSDQAVQTRAIRIPALVATKCCPLYGLHDLSVTVLRPGVHDQSDNIQTSLNQILTAILPKKLVPRALQERFNTGKNVN